MSYSIAKLQNLATPRIPFNISSAPDRIGETTVYWKDRKDRPCDELRPLGSYFFRQWWPTYPGIPVKTSTALIYNCPGKAEWRIAQHCSSADRPSSPTRFIAAMIDPVLVPHDADGYMQPLLDVDFSHAVWVEYATPDSDAIKRMRLATFASSGYDSKENAIQSSVKTLDVPNELLEEAAHLVIDQSQGSILISTESGEIHIYQYA
ncbi:hypothetical protein BD410DRAFT_791767 [Rickenella mellea]|uniref:Uncharacterized protein n=1 Tax=Rickenella mellea TaxID=50990 RepID=A0A4Y7PW69_9AGAM|nr:hypothetical protein BD410DRAFT_791767 [Rickenella mellea]